jgi:LuxR family maltose regulon positive regulatory protein
MGIIANSNLAEILMEQGQLHQAMKIYTDTLALATLADGQISPLAERVFAGLSRVSFEWNHLEAAAEHVHKCIEYSRRWGSIEFLAIGYTMLARLGHLQGNLEQVEEAIRAVQLLMNEYKLSPLHSIWIKYALVRLWIAQGEFERAADFLYKSGEPIFDPSGDGIHIKDEILYLQAPMILAKLRILLAQGSYEAALQLSEGLLRKEDGRKPTKRVIEILVLQALAFQGKQDMQQAIAALKEALSLAEPEGYMRTFLDEGEAMAALLKVSRLKTGGYIRKYIERLLSAHYGSRPGLELQPPMPPPEALIVALTPREVEVLKLIEAGNSNQDIANKLVISIPTVKRHISNLYAKLGVTNRTQAVSQGRELRLLV